MTPPVFPSDLSPAEHRLLIRMQQIRFGRIENLLVRASQPVIEPGTTTVTRKIKIRGQNRPHPGLASVAPLKSEVVELIQHLRTLGNGIVRSLTVVDGLPVELDVADDADDESSATAATAGCPRRPVSPAAAQ